MSNLKQMLGVLAGVATLGTIGTFMQPASGPAALKAQGLLPGVVAVPITGSVSVNNLPAVQNVNVTNTPLPVVLKPTLISDGTFFNVTMTGTPSGGPAQPKFFIPAGVVLTDAHAGLTVSTVPNTAVLFISDRSKVYVNQVIAQGTGEAAVDLHSGIVSDGSLIVSFACANIANNQCEGAIFWTGYQQ
jgi:hypothetical protein